jgi:predicted DNA-binding transcriptional regulator YafY
VLDLKLVDHRQSREVIRTVQWALVERKQLTGLYRSPYETKPVKLMLHPYRLALIKQAWYLIARSDKDIETRTYRIVRFQSLRMTDEAAVIPEDSNLTAYLGNAWGVYRGEACYEIELRFDADIASVVQETKWHHTQKAKRHADGTVSLHFTVDGLNEIVRWITGYAGQVRVVKPRELRELVIARHEAALKKNL